MAKIQLDELSIQKKPIKRSIFIINVQLDYGLVHIAMLAYKGCLSMLKMLMGRAAVVKVCFKRPREYKYIILKNGLKVS